jgi:amidase
MTDLADLDATAQAELVRRGEVKPLELVDAAIERIERIDPLLDAVIHERFEQAREEAGADLPDAPFRGVPFLVKDAVCMTEGDPYHLGMRFLKERGHRGDHDTWLAQRYRQAGFVFVGKTNLPELALAPTTEPVAYGPTRNPWDPERSPGGSSGGSAAAVAAGLVPVAHGNDMGGSIRIPASFCGLVGLKPTRARTTIGPDFGEYWGPTTHEHVLTRSVRDSAAVLDATRGPGPGDMAVAPPPLRPYVEEVGADPGRLKVGLLAHNPRGELHPDCEAAVREAARMLEALGHHVEESHPVPLDESETMVTFTARWCTNARRVVLATGNIVGRELTADDVEPITWIMSEAGRTFSAVDLASALAASALFTRRMAAWWAEGFDVLLTPTLGLPPPKLGELLDPNGGAERVAALVPFTTHFNVTGQPAISLPLHWNADGLPIGVQLAAAYGREDILFRVASQLEQAAPWADRRPPFAAS